MLQPEEEEEDDDDDECVLFAAPAPTAADDGGAALEVSALAAAMSGFDGATGVELKGVAASLAKAVDPPSAMAVKNALELLMAIGALTSDERLTKLGWRLGALPVDPRLGKMLLLASLLGCVDPMVSFLLFTVTFYANHAHNLTRSP